MDNKPCTICENSKKNNKKGEDGKKSFSDSTLNALIQEEVMSESNTSESLIFKTPEIKQTSNENESSFNFKTTIDDDFYEIKQFTTKSSLKSPSTTLNFPKIPSPKDTIYLDSDDEIGIVELVKNDHEFYSVSEIPVFKNKEQKNQPLAKLNAQSEFFSTKKNTYIDEHENNESSEIEDVDFGEDEPKNLFVNKQTGPIIKQNSHILAKSTQTNQSQSNSSSASIDQSSEINYNDKLGNKYGVSITPLSKYQKIKWLFQDIKDSSPHYHRLDYEHSDDMLITFRNLFGLKQFRPQQFEAVNAALTGSNCFVLMPTGGGKSLCYQLPACIDRGVTLVVSPLKSLIIDQVDKLNSLNITAAHLLSSGNSRDDKDEEVPNSNFVYQDLCRAEPTLKLLYLTPEKLNLSEKLTKILTSLYNRDMIARLVIDEAHCVSNWGHDFRKDYTQLGALRNRLFPNVPVMLLTATATPRVRKDILIQMSLSCDENLFNKSNAFEGNNSKLTNKLANRNYIASTNLNSIGNAKRQNCAFFIQSFNRENLQYKVEYKASNATALEKIVTIIKQKYTNKSGIVYCISRNECESVSDFLKKNGLKSLPYHAGMSDKDRQAVQHKWSNTVECRVVCATIAFGMGIDKADVRYVFHLGLPKSLEGYYQESGRAGRDGQVSLCYLFFNNQDRQKWLGLMKREQQQSRGDYEVFKVHVDNLYRMSQYCDNNTDCRRAQILEYFGEIFDRKNCIESKMGTACDNCLTLKANAFTLRDITKDAISICRGIQQVGVKDDITLLHLSEVLKGSKNQKVMEKNHHKLEMHAKLSKYKKNDIERIIRRLIFMGYLSEEVKVITYTDTVACYIKLGSKANQLIREKVNDKIEFDFIGGEETKSKYTFDNNINDDDEDEYFNNDCDESEMNKTSANKSSNKEKALKTRCATELKALAKDVCAQSNGQKVETIFPKKLLNEMLKKMPTDKNSFIKLEYYTEAKFNNYQGEKFLNIFRHYKNQLDELKEEELLQKAIEAEATASASAKIISKSYMPSSSFTQASFKQSKTYGLIDGESCNNWQSNSQNKRKSSSNLVKSSYNSKRAKTSHNENILSGGGEGTGNTSTTKFNYKKKIGSYKKKWNTNKFKKRF